MYFQRDNSIAGQGVWDGGSEVMRVGRDKQPGDFAEGLPGRVRDWLCLFQRLEKSWEVEDHILLTVIH